MDVSPWARSPGFVADWTTKTGAAVNYLPKNFLLDAVITQPIKRIVGSNVFPLVASVVGDGMVGFALGNTCSLAVAYPFSVVCTRGVFGLALPMEPSEVFAGIGVALAGIMTYRVSDCPPPTGAAVRCTHHSNSTPVVPLPFRLACSTVLTVLMGYLLYIHGPSNIHARTKIAQEVLHPVCTAAVGKVAGK